MECKAYDENPREYVDAEICPACPWSDRLFNPQLDRLLHVLGLLDAGCPVGRHELRDADWHALGRLRQEREKVAAEKMKQQAR